MFPTNRVIINSKSAKYIYENIIWNDQNRIKFVDLANVEMPSLIACALEIENYCISNPNNDLDLNNNTVKQTIGRMIAVAIESFGYTKVTKDHLSPSFGFSFFKNASTFKYTGGETQRIVKAIVDV